MCPSEREKGQGTHTRCETYPPAIRLVLLPFQGRTNQQGRTSMNEIMRQIVNDYIEKHMPDYLRYLYDVISIVSPTGSEQKKGSLAPGSGTRPGVRQRLSG